MPINNNWIKIGALVAALAVVLGGLDWHQFAPANSGQCSTEQATAAQAAAINKAAYFQFIHALAIILAGVIGVLRPSRMLWVTGFFFLLGIILFSGVRICPYSLTIIGWNTLGWRASSRLLVRGFYSWKPVAQAGIENTALSPQRSNSLRANFENIPPTFSFSISANGTQTLSNIVGHLVLVASLKHVCKKRVVFGHLFD